MLAIENKQLNSVFERIIKDKNGILLRVRFTVIEINGIFQGQIISAEPLVKEKVLCLPFLNESKVAIEKIIVLLQSILSPYFSLEFFMSQPTRAPSNR